MDSSQQPTQAWRVWYKLGILTSSILLHRSVFCPRTRIFDPEQSCHQVHYPDYPHKPLHARATCLGFSEVGSGILASLAAVGFPPEVLAQFAAVASIGGTAGTIIGRRITATELPQMVAALHSVVGLAAVLTSIGCVIGMVADHISTLHLVTAYLGVLIGGSSISSP